MTKKATFGAGCFWGVGAAFRQLDGVEATRVGYAGGGLDNPTYEDVCSHKTGHAEVVEVTYDPERVSYEELLQVFWHKHDATQPNRQAWDGGDQYRSYDALLSLQVGYLFSVGGDERQRGWRGQVGVTF